MNNLQAVIEDYLNYCQYQKRLDDKTQKAYRIDLNQFSNQIEICTVSSFPDISPTILENFIAQLYQKYKPKTVKGKISSLKALFHYLEFKEIQMEINHCRHFFANQSGKSLFD